MNGKTTWTIRQLSAWLALCVASMFVVLVHVNALDNLQHLNGDHPHEHSIFSMIDDDHDTHDADHGAKGDDAGKLHHCHPNLCGAFVLMQHVLNGTEVLFTSPAVLAWQQPSGVAIGRPSAHERPPKDASVHI